jgi:hypothetical protein
MDALAQLNTTLTGTQREEESMRSIRSVAAAVFVAILTMQSGAALQGQPSARPATAARFIGTWRLVSYETGGKPDPIRGVHPKGLIYYDATGHMAAQIASDRPMPSWPSGTQPTPEQAQEAVIGYVAYFGTYAVDERARTVTHHREGALNPNTVDLVRKYEFTEDGRLVLIPVDNPALKLTWERIHN